MRPVGPRGHTPRVDAFGQTEAAAHMGCMGPTMEISAQLTSTSLSEETRCRPKRGVAPQTGFGDAPDVTSSNVVGVWACVPPAARLQWRVETGADHHRTVECVARAVKLPPVHVPRHERRHFETRAAARERSLPALLVAVHLIVLRPEVSRRSAVGVDKHAPGRMFV
eukprot:CAMPEP_0179868310 /NCGR_PEP_ID=MMETSP0982-20121206/18762_1 /TAXON_ID=483367 /ORGANISM="non described non described, Strain CCMP 2436" /LENGTH=166 /DNA_ID=CAMNT_0021757981 /DNA_START=479 /DNA_END=980 /DNA_ORIENTATION=+